LGSHLETAQNTLGLAGPTDREDKHKEDGLEAHLSYMANSDVTLLLHSSATEGRLYSIWLK
jgi:hypothetical protein